MFQIILELRGAHKTQKEETAINTSPKPAIKSSEAIKEETIQAEKVKEKTIQSVNPSYLCNPKPIKTKKMGKSYLNWFLEQGAGMVGVLILVVGIAFLGIYSSLSMQAIERFLVLVLFSGILFGGSCKTL